MNQDTHEQGYAPGKKLGLLFVAWVATAVFTFPGVLVAPLLFPLGLLWAIGMSHLGTLSDQLSLILGWLTYLGLSAAACLTSRKGVYLLLYAALCALLALNVIGCRVMMGGR